jgi:hypothetical protein
MQSDKQKLSHFFAKQKSEPVLLAADVGRYLTRDGSGANVHFKS